MPASGGKAFQAEGTVGAKVLWPASDGLVGAARRSAPLEWREERNDSPGRVVWGWTATVRP